MNVNEMLGLPLLEGDVGVEIEVEGRQLPTRNTLHWQTTRDGSLRGGYEYVLKVPVKADDFPKAMEELLGEFERTGAKPDFSFRTSVHVHVNCLGLTYLQLLNFIYIGYLLEGILIDYSGEIRKGNRFCLRLRDADGLMYTLNDMFKAKDLRVIFPLLRQDALKYAAMNLASIRGLGTLEFRSMRGTIDPAVLLPWVQALVNIRTYATKFANPKEVQKAFMADGEKFAQEALGEKEFELMYQPELFPLLQESFSLTYELPHLVREEKKDPKARRKNPKPLNFGDLVRGIPAVEPDIQWDRIMEDARIQRAMFVERARDFGQVAPDF